jgi:tRNA A37 methylthiotransferase MiaB
VALLEAYAKQNARPGSLRFLTPLYKRLPIDRAVEQLRSADIVGFSVYVWNVRYSLAVARELKRHRPNILIVMGGPQVPDQAETFLREHPSVDLVCHGEGERTFLDIIKCREAQSWREVPSISYLDHDGSFVANPRRARMTDLDEVPSPMLDGTYEALMRSAPDQQWLATWETNRGCPFSCTFCDWGSATSSKIARYGEERLIREIEWMVDHGIHHLCVCDANFGILPRDVEIARWIARAYAQRRSPLAISVQSTKNRAERSQQIQQIFHDSRVVSFGASLSLQSVDAATLTAIRRSNISLKAFDKLQKHYAEQNLDTYSDLIIGLPGETYRSFVDGIGKVIRNGQLNRIAFYECFLLPNAPMANAEYRVRYAVETVPIRINHFHEPIGRDDAGEPEFMDMVISTSSMTRDDWVRARTFAYFVELLFFDRVLHLPIVILGSALGADFSRVLASFAEADARELPVINSVRQMFEEHAGSMLRGGPQYVAAPEFLNLYWPPDQYALIVLAQRDLLDAFYDEACRVLKRAMADEGIDADPVLIEDATRLNHAMLALPFHLSDEVVETRYPVLEAYQILLSGGQPDIAPGAAASRVHRTETIWMSWNAWCEDLVRRLFLRKKYLYPVSILNDRSAISAVVGNAHAGVVQGAAGHWGPALP